MLKIYLLKTTRYIAIVMAYLLLFGGAILFLAETETYIILTKLLSIAIMALGLTAAVTASVIKDKIMNTRQSIYEKNLNAALREAGKDRHRIESQDMAQFLLENPQYQAF